MAHVVGVPKRDPCQNCGLPVFLAERLMIGKRVYHRTCLKCARCRSQLTPGSFYETEVDGEYCCETCPDEETNLDEESPSILRNVSPESFNVNKAPDRPKTTVRSSIADRLAFFEQGKESPPPSSSSKLLQKSLSDEEKSKSLKKMNDEDTSSPQYKMNAALSSFMNSTLDDDDVIDGGKAMDTSESPTSSSDSDNEEDDKDGKENEEPPALPQTLPPPIIGSKPTTLERKKVPNPEELRTKTPEIALLPSQQKEDDEDERFVEETISTTSITLARTADDRNLSKSKSNFVTKDNTEPDEQMRTTNATMVVDSAPSDETATAAAAAGPAEEEENQVLDVHDDETENEEEQKEKENELLREKPPLRQRPVTLNIKANGNSDLMAGHEDEETTNRLSVVRARLHQFEVIASNKSTNNDNSLTHRTPEISPGGVSQNSFKSDISSARTATSAVAAAQEDENESVPSEAVHMTPSSSNVAEVELKSVEVPRNVEIEVKVEETPEEQNAESKVEEQQDTLDENVVPESSSQSVTEPVEMDDNSAKVEDKEQEVLEKPTAMEEEEKTEAIEQHLVVKPEIQKKPFTSPAKVNLELYPEELNPFKSDDENDDQVTPLPVTHLTKPITPAPRRSLLSPGSGKKEKNTSNPFDSSDDEIEVEKKIKPPRPPPPKISKNPFGSESEEGEENFSNGAKKTPVPAPRTNVSQNPTPEPTPRLSSKQSNHHTTPLNNSGEYYGSNSSLASTPYSLLRNTDVRGSNNSLTSSTGTIRSRKSRKGPAPPPPVKELFPSNETLDSKLSSPGSSNSTTPRQGRKKRPAPAPPKPARLHEITTTGLTAKIDGTNDTGPKNSLSYPLQSDLDKLSDEEKALLEGNRLERTSEQIIEASVVDFDDKNNPGRKLIQLDLSLVSDPDDLLKQADEHSVVYRRTIVPEKIMTPTHDEPVSHDRQLEKMKDNKEAQNRNRQSQVSSGAEDTDPLYNKSSHGKWKRRKGPAPALPIPPRKVLQMLPLQEIRHELDIIEVQQQGLEKQGVILEKMIRDRCEGKNGELEEVDKGTSGPAGQPQNSKEVEDLILQLFELVNEKNELFRRQAELMYLRRQHRLEQEQADLEYEIRVLMAQPERNKTDSDKAREEALIARLVEVVQLRNEVVECLEMDRLREAEEDLSIKQRLEIHTAKREQEMNRHTLSKLSKKERKKQKEAKKLGKSKKLDADKDADESELSAETQKIKKKKKKFLF